MAPPQKVIRKRHKWYASCRVLLDVLHLLGVHYVHIIRLDLGKRLRHPGEPVPLHFKDSGVWNVCDLLCDLLRVLELDIRRLLGWVGLVPLEADDCRA